MRLIDADALKDLPFNRLIHTDFGDTCVSFEEIDNAPTIEFSQKITITPQTEEENKRLIEAFRTISPILVSSLERKTGHWIKIGEIGLAYKCDKCDVPNVIQTDFCPNCGADMRGGRE